MLRAYCNDSKSCLTSKLIQLPEYPYIKFSIDVAIINEDEDSSWYRLIHDKDNGQYYWNETPIDFEIKEKSASIKKCGEWQTVRNEYLRLKNLYLRRNDRNHPSRVLYRESVNNVYNRLKSVKFDVIDSAKFKTQTMHGNRY